MTTTTPSPYGSLAFHSLSSVVCGGGSDDYCSVVADEYSMQRKASVDGDADERKIDLLLHQKGEYVVSDKTSNFSRGVVTDDS